MSVFIEQEADSDGHLRWAESPIQVGLTLKPRYLSYPALYTLQVQKGEVTTPVCFLPSFLLGWALNLRDTLFF